jgi:glycosyltransferase involved in cell wall biosynthesis
MRIGIDVSIQETPYVTGVERVQRSLLEALAAIDRENEYLLVSKKPLELPFERPANWRTVAVVRGGSPYLWRERFVPQLLDREKIDVFHSPVSATPILGRAKKIATLHELPWIERGAADHAVESAPASHRVWLYLNVRWTSQLVCVSERTRQNVLSIYPAAAPRLSVIHHGIDSRFRKLDPPPDRAAVLGRLAIPDRPFVLFVGTLRRKKNLRLLLEAFAGFTGASKKRYQLVLAGVRGTTFSEIEDTLNDPRLAGRVVLPGYVADDDLVALYNLASCVVYPSRFEGFGLPPLEAMACGAPVVASNGGAIPEVVGDAAAMFDPADGVALRENLLRVLEDREFAAALVARGAAHARKFTWERAARQYLALYRATADIEVNASREASAGG